MSTYYRLNPEYLLRGWDKLPFAVVSARTKQVTFISKSMMSTLRICDGTWDFDSVFCAESDCANAAKLLEKGFISACDGNGELAHEQHYRVYPNRFVEAVHWSITGRCNFRCKHCFMSAPEARYGEFSHETVMGIARQIGECGIPQVSLTGGEPLVRRDFLEIAAELTRQGVGIRQLFTNGSLLTPEILDGLSELGQRPTIVMSFDGVGYHDWMRGVDGAEAAADAAFSLCAEKGFNSHAQMIMYKDNTHTLRATINHLAAVGCKSIRVGGVNDIGDWTHNSHGRTLDIDSIYEEMLRYLPHYYEDGMPMSMTLAGLFAADPERPDLYNLPLCKPNGDKESVPLFSCTRNVMQLYADGRPAVCDNLGPEFVDALPVASDDPTCETMPLQVQLSTGSPYMRLMDMRRGELCQANQECATCPYLRLCGGGCRAAAYASSGSILGTDKRSCVFFRGGWASRVIQAMREIRPDATTPTMNDPLFLGQIADESGRSCV